MSYIDKNGNFNHAKWQRDQILNEGPENDPALKSLRIKKKGELMPTLSKWWEYDPDDIMRFVYWGKGQMPPTDQKVRSQEFANLVKQLHVKYPIPSDAEGMVDPPEGFIGEASGTKTFEPGDMWSEDFDYVGMLQWGANASAETMDLETLKAGYESFTDVNYHTEAQDLGNAIDWMEDNPTTDDEYSRIEDFMSNFNSASAKTLKDITRR